MKMVILKNKFNTCFFLCIYLIGDNMDKTVAFPLMGNYYVPANFLFSKISRCKILKPPQITSKTIELGSKYSPDFLCTPFKYTLGTYIECLDMGADTLIQMGGGCRYGYYCELQEKILKDLGYNFNYYNLVTKGHTDIKRIYNIMKEINPKFNVLKSLYYLLITKKMVEYMDYIDNYIRENSAYGDTLKFNECLNNMLEEFSIVKTYIGLRKKFNKYKKEIKSIEIKRPENNIKIGIIGELYTLMEPFANNNLESMLIKSGVEIKRFTNVTYLLFKKSKKSKKYLKKLKNIKYKMGADAMDNIYYTKYLIDNNYDGIIHIKSSFCTPEIGSMGIINKMCEDNNMPVLFFSMDANTSNVGFETRIEAFLDMIEMRKKNG